LYVETFTRTGFRKVPIAGVERLGALV